MALEPMKLITVDERSEVVVVVVAVNEPARGPSNPMLIDLVIDNMFGYCDFATLARCRQVSKQWFKVSLPHWLKRGPRLELLLYDIPSEPSYRDENETYMSEFLQLVSSSTTSEEYEYCGLRQYKKFSVRGGDVNERHRELLAEFLSKHGECITDLELSVTFADVETYQTVMLSRKTPNLVKLEADVWFHEGVDFGNAAYEVEHDVHEKLKTLQIDFEPYGRRPPLPVLLWIQLLKRYPNLKTLVHGIGVGAASRPINADNMLEAVWTIRQMDKKALDLKRLEVCCTERNYDDVGTVRRPYQLNSLMPLFRDAQLKLETFSISIGELTPSQTIYEVLDSQAATLKTLVLDLHYLNLGRLGNIVQPPQMDCVTDLELRGHYCPFPTLAFLNAFPNLESLTFDFKYNTSEDICTVVDDTNDEMLEGGLMLPTLNKLHCKYFGLDYHGYFGPEQIRKLRRIMPNLTDVQLWLDNESFRAVCGCWPALKSLRIFGSQVDDEGLLGSIDRDGNMLPNIRNLKELESFAMSHDGFNERFLEHVDVPMPITGACVIPLLYLPELKKLDITLAKKHKREHGGLLNTPVIRVDGREIDVKIKFVDPLNRWDFEDPSDSDYSGYSGSEDDGDEFYQGLNEDEDDIESAEDQNDVDEDGVDGDGESVQEESEKEEGGEGQVDDDTQLDSDGDAGGIDKGENNDGESDADERDDDDGVSEEAENDGDGGGKSDIGESQDGGGGVDDGAE